MANIDDNTPTTRARVAVKTFIDAAGNTVDIERATGCRYVSVSDGKNGKTLDLQMPGAVAGSVQTMCALFGWSTQATAAATSNRERVANDPERFADDTDAVAERWSRLVDGDWGAKAGGGGLAIDTAVLYDAVDANVPDADRETWAQTTREDWIALMDLPENKATRSKIRNHAAIAPVYDRLVREKRNAGKPEENLSDLLKASLGA